MYPFLYVYCCVDTHAQEFFRGAPISHLFRPYGQTISTRLSTHVICNFHSPADEDRWPMMTPQKFTFTGSPPQKISSIGGVWILNGMARVPCKFHNTGSDESNYYTNANIRFPKDQNVTSIPRL